MKRVSAPANYLEIAGFLAGLGIDSISVNPATIMRTIAMVAEAEKKASAANAAQGG